VVGIGWDLTSFAAFSLRGISEQIPGKALTSNQKSCKWSLHILHQHALHRTPRGPSPCQRIAFHNRTSQNGEHKLAHAAGPIGRKPQLMNNLLLRMGRVRPLSRRTSFSERNPKKILTAPFFPECDQLSFVTRS
jgi:hypothetical protein